MALDSRGDEVVKRLAERTWSGTRFLRRDAVLGSASPRGTGVRDGRDTAALSDAALDELAAADLVVMVVEAGMDAPAARAIGRYCSDRNVSTATFVVGADSAADEALSRTLEQVRPWSLMVVVANDEDYVEDILRSLR
jgi:hypothetical protein